MFFSSFLAGARFLLTKTLWIPKIFSEKVVWQADFYETFPFKATAYFPANISSLFDRIAHIDSDMDVKVMLHETTQHSEATLLRHCFE